VVNAFTVGTTNRWVAEKMMFSLGPTTVTWIFEIANKCANKELGEDSSSEPSWQERSPPRLKSKSLQDAPEEDSPEHQD
jgi:hypothetical protein